MKTIEPSEIISLLLDKSKKYGSTDAEVILTKNFGKNLSFRNGTEEKLEEFNSFNVGIRVFRGKKYSVLSTNKIDENSLLKLSENANEIAKVSQEDKLSFVATKEDHKIYPVNEKIRINPYDDYQPSILRMKTKAQETENHALETSNKLISDGVQVSWSKSQIYYSNSNGFYNTRKKSINTNSLTLITSKSDKMERDYHYSSKVFFNDLEETVSIANKTAEKVLKKIGSSKPPTGKYPIIFEPRVSRSILNHIVLALNGSSIVNGTSFLKGCINEKLFNEEINVIDNPHILKGLGSKLFDAEGLGTKKIDLISNGIVKNYLLNLSTAKQLNLKTNCNAVRNLSSPPSTGITNVLIRPGKTSEMEMINNISNGFYVTELLGSSVSLITGDYSRGANGFWIKNGVISYPISEATIAGNLKDMFLKMLPASNLDINSTISAPSIFIDEMTIAGGSNSK